MTRLWYVSFLIYRNNQFRRDRYIKLIVAPYESNSSYNVFIVSQFILISYLAPEMVEKFSQ